MESGEELWKRIDELRGTMSIRELSEKAGLLERSVQTTRCVKTMPKMSMLYPMAKVLHTTMDYLYSGKESPDDFDTPTFRKLSSSQDLIDICNALVDADKAEIEIIKRILQIDKPQPPVQQELF